MSAVQFVADGFDGLAVRAFTAVERLGEIPSFEIELLSPAPITVADMLGRAAFLAFGTPASGRAVAGIVTRTAAKMTSISSAARVYRVTLRPRLALLELRRRSRIFQHKSAPQIVEQLAQEAGYPGASIQVATTGSHPAREYVVQYDETDATFLRRICEENGLYFRFAVNGDGAEVFSLEDTSSSASAAPFDALPLVDVAGLGNIGVAAFDCAHGARRRAGKVTLRDYAFEKPALALEATATAGNDVEKAIEVYEAPGRFQSPGEGSTRAKLRLESLRADSASVRFRTTAFSIAPGLVVHLEVAPSLEYEPPPPSDVFVVEVRHAFREGEAIHACDVVAVPKDLPFRLRRATPRPRLAGVQTAFVTGARGEEVHTEKLGRVKLQFPWDLEGQSDDKTTLPIRVMQPNTPGSMALPRVGWEVVVAFEQGDPDRPLVLGRLYNGKFPPPYKLPANKTVTALQTYSSPGSGKTTSIRFDDASGKQHFYVQAPFAKTTTVANDMMTQTAKNENVGITGSQSRSVGGPEKVSVTQGYFTAVGSQSGTVGAAQKIYVGGKNIHTVGSETVLVGGAVLEKVGNPVTGLTNLGKAAVLAGVGAAGTAGAVVSAAGGIGLAAYDGYKQGGWSGALQSAGMGAGGLVAGMVPGGEAIFSIATDSAQPAPWREGPAPGGDTAGGGGGSGASDGAGAAGPGPGHRNTLVKSTMTEMIGGALAIVTPGTVGWYTVGAATYLIGGSKTVKSARGGVSVLGASTETMASLKIETKAGLSREVTGAINTTIAGALKSEASGKHTIKAGASITLRIAGSLKLEGSTVSFNCNGATVTAAPGGVLLQAGSITINKASTQSGATGHS